MENGDQPRADTPPPTAAIAQIRRIYFKTTRHTIDHDFDHAIELLKGLATEEERERATVYMEGIAQMRKDWARKSGRSERSGKSGRSRSLKVKKVDK